MELQEFIKNSLIGIKNGVHAANLELAKQENKVLGQDAAAYFVLESSRDNAQNYITFDVAVTVSQESKKSGGGGVRVAVVNIGGEIGNIKSQENISRIKFCVISHITTG
jgi:hypothetical protein